MDHSLIQKMRRIIVSLSFATGTLFILLGAVNVANSASDSTATSARSMPVMQQPVNSNCATVTDIPQTECQALEELYRETKGRHWMNNTNWLSVTQTITPCDWYGVTCVGGHVTKLRLARNGLVGKLPSQLGNFTHLKLLRLENNALNGFIPRKICALQDTLSDANFAYNALYTRRRRVNECMSMMDPDWRDTQTSKPTDLMVTQISTTSIGISWKPIAYTADAGGYEIAYRTEATGTAIFHGRTTDKSVSTYLLDGLEPGRSYFVGVRSTTLAHDDQPNTLTSESTTRPMVTAIDGQSILIAAYFAADNDLAPQIPNIVSRFRLGTYLNPNAQVVLLVDGRGDDNTRIVEIANGVVKQTNIVMQQWGIQELDTADPAILSSFLQYARDNYPADRTIVTLLGHGIALAPEVEWETVATAASLSRSSSNEIPPLPQEWEGTPNDITNRSYMSTTDMGKALMDATDDGANPFDLVFFDQCFQGNLDALYEVHKTSEIFVASPNYGWLVAAYAQYMTQFAPDTTNEEMADSIVKRYQRTLNNDHPNTIFWVRGDQIPPIAEAVSNLGDALRSALQNDEKEAIAAAVKNAQFVDTTQCGKQNFVLGPPDELMGADTFAANLQRGFAENDPDGVHAAAGALLAELETLQEQKLSRVGTPYIAPEVTWNYTDTLTILAPLPRNSDPKVAWRSTIYREDAPFAAEWTIDPSQTVSVTSSFAFVMDYNWDEFLNEWYEERPATVGEWCNYIPIEQVLIEDIEPISLTLAMSGTNALQLEWTPTDHEDASEYRIYGQGPYDVGPIVYATTSITQTSVVANGLSEGEYQLSVVAFSEVDEAAVAQSPTVSATVDGGTFGDMKDLFLPIILR